MKLYTVFKVHKIAGLAFGSILLLLGATGFFLDHENFNFLWDIKVSDSLLPPSIVEKKLKTINAYKIDTANPEHIIAGSRMGLFVSFDGGESFEKTLNQQIHAIEPERLKHQEDFNKLYAATSNGIYYSGDGGRQWELFALQNKVVESFSQYEGKIYAVVDKRNVIQVDLQTQQTHKLSLQKIPASELPKQVTLSRLVRDLHYGRGLFSGDSSLYINDYAAIILSFLGISGLVIYFMIRKIRAKQKVNRKYFKLWQKSHSNIIIILSFLPILMLLVTGVFLDHSQLLQNFMKNTVMHSSYLPPVYKNLSTDIWGFDFDGKNYRIGNRLGVFKSSDKKTWQLESKGFAYRIKRVGNELFISGMGSSNKKLTQEGWVLLKDTPSMPRDIYQLNGEIKFYSSHHAHHTKLPQLDSTPLYLIMLGLHDGELLYGQWVFVNDAAAVAGLILLITGFIKWRRKRTIKKQCQSAD